MAYSRVVAIGDGTTTQFTVNFALDYLLQTDVTCRVGAEVDGSGFPIYRPITFLSTNFIQVSGAAPGNGVQIVFDRTVDKATLRVDYNNGDQLDEDNLMIAQKQAMMAVHEVLDGKFDDNATSEANAALALAQANIAVQAKIDAQAAETAAAAIAATALASPASIIAIAIDPTAGSGGDDHAVLQAALDAVYAEGGGMVILRRNKRYRNVVTNATTNRGLVVWPGCTLLLNGSGIYHECDGAVFGLRNLGHVIGPGTVKTAASTATISQNIHHSPISIGYDYGSMATVTAAAASLFAAPSGWSVRNLTLDSVVNHVVGGNQVGSFINCWGGCNNGVIEDITIPDTATVTLGVAMDWAPVGNIDISTAANATATAVRFNAGTAYTAHPHDIEVRRIKIGNMSTPNNGQFGSHAIRLSGCYRIRVDGVVAAGTTYAGIFHTAGDVGFEFAPNAVKINRYQGTSFKNIRIEQANNGWGVFCDCFADNIAVAVAGGYSNILPTQGETNILFENVYTNGSLSAGALPGWRMQNMTGGTILNCHARGHSDGLLVETDCDKLTIIGGWYESNWLNGINVISGNAAEDTVIDGVYCFSNGFDGIGHAGISLGGAIRPVVRNCKLGGTAESFQKFGIQLLSTEGAIIEKNYVNSVKAGGTAYVMGGSTDYGMLLLYSGNRCAASIASKYSGINIVPYEYMLSSSGIIQKCRASHTSLSSDTTPTTGTWTAGTIIEFDNPVAGGNWASICTTGGTIGAGAVFKLMGGVAA